MKPHRLVQTLRHKRNQSPSTLKTGAQQAFTQLINFRNTLQNRVMLSFSVGFGLIAFTFADIYRQGLSTDFSVGIQITVFLLALCISTSACYAMLFKKSIFRNLDRIIFWMIAGIALTYSFILFNTVYRSYTDYAWSSLFHPSSLQLKILSLRILKQAKRPDLFLFWVKGTLACFCAFSALYCLRVLLSETGSRVPVGFRLWLGTSTGLLAALKHGSGLSSKQPVTLSLEDAAQNIVILGAIGSGKTTCAIHPLLVQLFEQNCGGLIFDIKGDFKRAVNEFSSITGRQEHLCVIGERGITLNLIQGLSPELAASFLRSMLLSQGKANDPFWIDSATQLCSHVLGILSFFPRYYHLAGLYHYLFESQLRAQIKNDIGQLHLEPKQERLLQNYVHYYDGVFANFDEKVQTGVLATVSQLLTPFQNPTLVDIFCQDSDFAMESVLEGTVFLVDLPLAHWGMGAKVVYNFIKLRFFNTLQQRPIETHWNQTNPVFFMCDEYQEIVSANTEGLSDLSFWDKSRSSKTIGIISTQSVSSFYAALGNHDVANAILQNFRQKICFRTEDQATLNLLNRLAGEVEVIKYSSSMQRGSSGSGLFPSHSTRSQTLGEGYTQRHVIDAQMVRNLEPGQAVALLSIQNHSCDDVMEMFPVVLQN